MQFLSLKYAMSMVPITDTRYIKSGILWNNDGLRFSYDIGNPRILKQHLQYGLLKGFVEANLHYGEVS